ncbi:MAG: hypothetical protein GY778_13625 [bacterium]|nr:hypothetical protein [bacterium]
MINTVAPSITPTAVAVVLLAQTSMQQQQFMQYGVVTVIALLVVRESFALVWKVSEARRRRRNGDPICTNCEPLVLVRLDLQRLETRIDGLERAIRRE